MPGRCYFLRDETMRIIINADDFGMNPCVNDRILELLSLRRITSVSLIANAPAIEDAVRRLPKLTGYSVGVHLNLTEFRPLTPPEEFGDFGSLLDGKGCFLGEQSLREKKMTSRLREEIYKELALQVERVIALGVTVSHFDSHNHVHTIPTLFPVVKRLQRQFSIRKVRTTWNVRPPAQQSPVSIVFKKRLWDLALRTYFRTNTTSGFTSFAMFYDLAKTRGLDHDSIELMVHPGHPFFEEETQLLYTDWQNVLPFSAELISYHDL